MESEEIRHNLQTEFQRLGTVRDDIRVVQDLDGEPTVHLDDDLSNVDQHPADSGTQQMQREIDFSLLEQVEAEIAEVERALHKLDQGSYGICEACGESIEEERLEAQPAARFCIKDQSSH